MTGRYLADDFNAEVRQTVRRTMDEVNPDTILLGEHTNDGAADFQGDGWQGAMTYANFTRPLWGWLSEPNAPSSYFGQPTGVIPSYTGRQFFEAHRHFSAGFPWRSRLGNMNALDTHDVPRFATNARAGALPVAVGLAATFVGMPVIWSGDEFGLVGEDGEASREPMPWGRVTAQGEEVLAMYRELMPHRGEHVALTDGGMRWLHAGDDVLVYVREHAEESVLCVASRAPYRLRLAADAVLGGAEAELLFGPGRLVAGDGEAGVELAADGISFTMWKLPGVVAP
jgi:alpha-glucosidase